MGNVLSIPNLIAGKPLGLGTAHASALIGLEARPIVVEACCSRGPAFFRMVGLAEAAVREARVRVSSALAALGVLLDEYAITVNLAPADLKKSGTALDLALACAILRATGQLSDSTSASESPLLLGELALDGSLRPVRGVLPQLLGARTRGVKSAIVARDNAAEAGLVEDVATVSAGSLEEVVLHLSGRRKLTPIQPTALPSGTATPLEGDLSEVRGQSGPRRALEITAAGGHNLLMVGAPGGGKTLLARLLPTILPPLSHEEAIETTAIHSVAGLLPAGTGAVQYRPFRAPHHSVSEAALVGGGDVPRPGEVSLAHHGVLFLDELAEFRRAALEALRQPLEDGRVCIARARGRAWFPARPVLVAAVNPCPCGYYGHPERACRCSTATRLRYQARLSGPLLDRLDVHVAVPAVDVSSLLSQRHGESSESVRDRVRAARDLQQARAREHGLRSKINATLSRAELDQVVKLDGESRRLLKSAVRTLGLSARAFVRVLRVARTIADLERSSAVRATHIAEAVQGRLLDREALR